MPTVGPEWVAWWHESSERHLVSYSWCTFGASNPQSLVARLPRLISFPICYSIFFPYHESGTSLEQTAERGIIFVVAKGLYVTFQSFSEPKLSSPFQHPQYLLLPLALNCLQYTEEYVPVIAPWCGSHAFLRYLAQRDTTTFIPTLDAAALEI